MKTDTKSIEQWKSEIVNTEKAFAKIAREEGVKIAFLAFASEEAVLMRSDKLIIGKKAIGNYFDRQSAIFENATLSWEPSFVEVAASGDLGYSYGQYSFVSKDADGAEQESNGIFHTVWKRAEDGSWRFVWD